MFFEKVASVARLSDQSDNPNKERYVTIQNPIRINIQPATPELTAVAEGVYGQVYEAYVSYSGLQIGDQITVSGNSDKYIVKGIRDWGYGPLPHYEVVLFKGD